MIWDLFLLPIGELSDRCRFFKVFSLFTNFQVFSFFFLGEGLLSFEIFSTIFSNFEIFLKFSKLSTSLESSKSFNLFSINSKLSTESFSLFSKSSLWDLFTVSAFSWFFIEKLLFLLNFEIFQSIISFSAAAISASAYIFVTLSNI